MDNEQAKLILSAYRSNGEDQSDPFFAEALALAHSDPGLRSWFEDHCDFDKSMHAALASQEPPPHLRESLLLGKKVLNFEEQHQQGTRSWWDRWSSKVALAAALTLLAGLSALILPMTKSPMTSERFVQETMQIKTSGRISLGRMSKDKQVLRDWLADRSSPHNFAIPDALGALTSLGCQTFSIEGSTVTLMCFTLDKDHVVHLFVINSDRLKDPPGSSPGFQQKDGLVTATWSSGGRTFVLLGSNIDEETLRRLI